MQIRNLKDALTEAKPNPAVKISIAALTDDYHWRLYATELLPQAFVAAHVHSCGVEVYHIISGTGTMYTGEIIDKKTGEVRWNEQEQVVQSGDTFEIDPGTVHQLKNDGDRPLILMFGCDPNHLEFDKQIVSDHPKVRLA